ncbi:MAG: high-potential iron-sulfur protein [Actinomycetota bacterium]
MRDNKKIWLVNVSRRSVLQGAISAVVASPMILAMANRAAAAKMSKASVGYRNAPNGSQSCANCRLFVAPSSCQAVQGSISPKGWCKIYVAK